MFYLVAFSIIFILLIFLSWIWAPDSPWAPWWKTNKETARAVCKLANLTSKDKLYELGSGDAEMLLVASKEYSAKCTGIEIDPARHLIAKVRTILSGMSDNIQLIKDNFFNINIRPATVVFIYLVPNAIKRLMPKLKKELKPGTRIVSFRYPIKELKLVKQDKKHRLFLYKI